MCSIIIVLACVPPLSTVYESFAHFIATCFSAPAEKVRLSSSCLTYGFDFIIEKEKEEESMTSTRNESFSAQ